jgi:hypothetical protein
MLNIFNTSNIIKCSCFLSIYSLCFSIDGTQLFATAGHDVLVYRSIDGYLLHSLKGKYIL